MKRTLPASILVVLLVITISVASCAIGSCFEETQSYLKASFYKNDTEKLTAPDSLTIFGLSRDTSKLYENSGGITHALLPLDASALSCKFVVTINNLTDTVEFQYSTYPHLISKECGYTFYHELDSAIFTKHIIKGIFRSNNTVTNLNVENIRIFY